MARVDKAGGGVLLAFDLNQSAFMQAAGIASQLTELVVKHTENAVPLAVQFSKGGVVQNMADPITAIFELKTIPNFNQNPPAARIATVTKTGAGTTATYTLLLDVDTTQIREDLSIGTGNGNPSAAYYGELQVIDVNGAEWKSQTLTVTVQNDVVKDGDTFPNTIVLPSGYVTPGINFDGLPVRPGATLSNVVPDDFVDAGGFDLSAITVIAGQDATLTQDGGALRPTPGGNAQMTVTAHAIDPGYAVTQIAGGNDVGISGEGSPAAGGNAALSFTSNTFTSARSFVQSMIAGSGALANQGGSASLTYSGNAVLTTLDLSDLTLIQADNTTGAITLTISGNAALSSVAMAAHCVLEFPGSGPGMGLDFSSNALTAAAINVILSSLTNAGANVPNADTSPATLDLSGGTNDTPDATGIAYIASLTLASWTVYNN